MFFSFPAFQATWHIWPLANSCEMSAPLYEARNASQQARVCFHVTFFTRRQETRFCKHGCKSLRSLLHTFPHIVWLPGTSGRGRPLWPLSPFSWLEWHHFQGGAGHEGDKERVSKEEVGQQSRYATEMGAMSWGRKRKTTTRKQTNICWQIGTNMDLKLTYIK